MDWTTKLATSARPNAALLVTLAALIVVANAFAVGFVVREHAIYYWDWSGYWVQASDLSRLLIHHPRSTLISSALSIRSADYNVIPILPVVPVLWAFGPGRMPYVIGITNLFLLPAAIALGMFAARQLRPTATGGAYAAATLLATASILALPALWAPALRGLPDVAGLVLVAIILAYHLATPVAEQRLRKLMITGGLLCLLILVRRWYIFWVVAFFPAVALAQLSEILHSNVERRALVAVARNLCVIGLTAAAALFLIATPFVFRSAHIASSNAYSAYLFSSSSSLAALRVLRYFGWGVVACAIAGLVSLVARQQTRALGVLLIAQSGICFVLFARVQDFDIHHFYLLLPAVGVGVAATVLGLWERIKPTYWRAAAVGGVFVLLVSDLASVFVPEAGRYGTALGGLVSDQRYYPLVRSDLDALSALEHDVAQLETRRPGNIYVLASSETLNSSIFQNACRSDAGLQPTCNRILPTNDVDRRDGFPKQFLGADYLVVATPTQYHLRPTDQRVVGVLTRDVVEDVGIGRSFLQLPDAFTLDGGVVVHVYQKTRDPSSAELDALATEFARYYPGDPALFKARLDGAR